MDEKPKSLWKKSLGPNSFVISLLVAAASAAIIVETSSLRGWDVNAGAWVVLTLVLWLLIAAIRWLCCWRNFKRFLFGGACFATLIALFYAEEDWRGWHAWNQFKHQWEAKGEHFDFASVIPPAVPDDQNFALTPVVASCYETYFDKKGHEVKPRNTNVVDRLSILSWRDISYENQREKVPDSAGWQAAQKMDLKAWQAFFRSPPPTNSVRANSFPTAPHPQAPADDILLALSKYDSVIEEIRQASQLPYSRFPLTYDSEDKPSILLPHLGALKTCEMAIRLRSLAELQKKQPQQALEDVRLELYLANSLQTETFLISQMVRLSMVEIALQPVWEGLAEHRWSESQLIALDAELAKLNFLADGQKALKAEISFAAEETIFLRRHRDYASQFVQWGFSDSDSFKFRFAIYHIMPSGWFYQSALKNSRMLLEYLPAVNSDTKVISTTLVRHANAAASKGKSFFDPLEMLREIFKANDFSMGNFLKKIAAGQTFVDLARTAIALERHRLAHGEYPESLDALAPQFIAKVPHDVIGGQPLKYRREANGQFVLYSVGWNEKDDGGVVARSGPFGKSGNVDINKGDWVWRYPKKE